MRPSVNTFLKTHTKRNKGGVSSTVRDSKAAPYHWRKDLNFSHIEAIQEKCGEAMRRWGYTMYSSDDERKNIHPVHEFTL